MKKFLEVFSRDGKGVKENEGVTNGLAESEADGLTVGDGENVGEHLEKSEGGDFNALEVPAVVLPRLLLQKSLVIGSAGEENGVGGLDGGTGRRR